MKKIFLKYMMLINKFLTLSYNSSFYINLTNVLIKVNAAENQIQRPSIFP